LKLKGLDPHGRYQIDGLFGSFGGDELMSVGLRVKGLTSDYQSCSWLLKRVE